VALAGLYSVVLQMGLYGLLMLFFKYAADDESGKDMIDITKKVKEGSEVEGGSGYYSGGLITNGLLLLWTFIRSVVSLLGSPYMSLHFIWLTFITFAFTSYLGSLMQRK
jgi:hypothetical protein